MTTMPTMTDSEILTRGFQALVDLFGNVDAERFITLTLREPRDYTKWREENLFLDGDLHAEAERSRAAGSLFRQRYAPHVPTI